MKWSLALGSSRQLRQAMSDSSDQLSGDDSTPLPAEQPDLAAQALLFYPDDVTIFDSTQFSTPLLVLHVTHCHLSHLPTVCCAARAPRHVRPLYSYFHPPMLRVSLPQPRSPQECGCEPLRAGEPAATHRASLTLRPIPTSTAAIGPVVATLGRSVSI